MEFWGMIFMVFIGIPLVAIWGSNKEAKEKEQRNASYRKKYGQAMDLMTVYGNSEKDTVSRSKYGSVLGEINFTAEESKVFSHSYKPAETVYRGVSAGSIHVGSSAYDPGGMVEKSTGTHRGYIEAYKYPHRYTVEKVELSKEIQGIYAADPLYKKYAVNGTILCNNGKKFADSELVTWSKLNPYMQAEYGSLLLDKQRLSYKECQEIVTLLRRIQDGITPEEFEKQKSRAWVTLLMLILGILLAYLLAYIYYLFLF